MIIDSPVFENNGYLPELYSFNGMDVSPPLSWYEAHEDTESYVLICDDADSSKGNRIHWLYFDIPWDVMDLPEDVQKCSKPYTGGFQGVNDFKNIGYDGPLAPSGTHRYRFKVYALDIVLELSDPATWNRVIKSMEGHVLDQAEIIGLYNR